MLHSDQVKSVQHHLDHAQLKKNSLYSLGTSNPPDKKG